MKKTEVKRHLKLIFTTLKRVAQKSEDCGAIDNCDNALWVNDKIKDAIENLDVVRFPKRKRGSK